MKKYFITGSSGQIGRYLLPLLSCNANNQIYCVSRKKEVNNNSFNVNYINLDLFDFNKVNDILSKIKPNVLIHLAGCSSDPNYKNTDLNYKLLASTINLASSFIKFGGGKILNFGSSTEYKISNHYHKFCENDELDKDKNDYVFCKIKGHEILTRLCKLNNVSYCYSRIFNVFGLEDNVRLVGSIYDTLKKGQKFILNNGNLSLDFLLASDVAQAIFRIEQANYSGVINICSGEAICLSNIALQIANFLECGLSNLELKRDSKPTIFLGDCTLLSKLDFKPQVIFNNDLSVYNFLRSIKLKTK